MFFYLEESVVGFEPRAVCLGFAECTALKTVEPTLLNLLVEDKSPKLIYKEKEKFPAAGAGNE